jgi:hypothetical protein
MGRGLAGRPEACAAHPHRPAVDRCDDCLQPFCPECLVRGGETLRCRVYTDSAPARAAAAAAAGQTAPRLRRALRARVGGLVAAAERQPGSFVLAPRGGTAPLLTP